MSYILDALKKAERERGLNQIPTLSTVHDVEEKPAGRFWIFSIAALTLLVAAAALLLYVWTRNDNPPAESGDYAAQQTGAGLPASVDNGIYRAGTDTPSPEPSRRGKNRAADSEESPVRQSERPEISSDVSSASMTRNSTVGSRIAGREAQSDAIPPQGTRKPVSPPPFSSASAENSRQIPNLASDNTGDSDSRVQSSDPADRESALRQAMEAMHISILLHSETPSDRLVFINGRKYVEGDYIDGRFLLETITPDGAVLSYKGARAVLKPKTD
jgi:general secretion pathway protein B